jgi:O-antigen/teichoic acid export membrane protein
LQGIAADPPQSLAQRAADSVKWSALTEIVTRTVSPLTYVILARLLAPEDFGVVTTAVLAISLSQVIWDAGLGRALIQTREPPETAANVVFWSNLALAIGAYWILFLLAPRLAIFFDSHSSELVLRVLGCQALIGSLAAVQKVLFERDLGFRRLFWMRAAASLVPGVVSIPLAFLGCGVWSLVAGSLAGSVIETILLWQKSRWRPKFSYDWHLARKLSGFGIWVLGEALAGWLFNWGDSFVVGKFLGMEALGVYRVAMYTIEVLFGLTLSPILTVAYPVFSRLQHDREALSQAFDRVNRMVILLALPLGIALLLLAPEFVRFLLGGRWDGVGSVLGILGLRAGLSWLAGTNPELYRAMGRPDINTKLMIGVLLYYLPVCFVASPFGLMTFASALLGLTLVTLPIHVYLCVKILDVPPSYLWIQGRTAVFGSLAMSAVLVALKGALKYAGLELPASLTFLGSTMLGALCYIGVIRLWDRSSVRETVRMMRN